MPKSGGRTPANPFLAWMNLGWKTAEMMTASAQVINHRANLMATPGIIPSEKNQEEFSRMGQEKLQASFESLMAMSKHITQTNINLWQQYLEHMLAVSIALLSLATSRNISQSLVRQQELIRTMLKSANTTADIMNTNARIFASGLRPLHKAATANAKRLNP